MNNDLSSNADIFLVYIVESPSPDDFYSNRSEGALLASAAALDGIPSVVRIVINHEKLVQALSFGIVDAAKHHPSRLPILHISAHGYDDGIQLSDGGTLSWEHLRELLIPLNKALNGGLILCMSTCKGYSACRMAMHASHNPSLPFCALVANTDEPRWSSTAVGYAAFYHRLLLGASVRDAVEAMKVASGDPNWVFDMADSIHRSYVEKFPPRGLAQALLAMQDTLRVTNPTNSAQKLPR